MLISSYTDRIEQSEERRLNATVAHGRHSCWAEQCFPDRKLDDMGPKSPSRP